MQSRLFLWYLFVAIILPHLRIKHPFLLKAIVISNPLTTVLPWHRVRATYLTEYSYFFNNYYCCNHSCTRSFYYFSCRSYFYHSYSLTQSWQFSSRYFVTHYQCAFCKNLKKKLFCNSYNLFPYVLYNILYGRPFDLVILSNFVILLVFKGMLQRIIEHFLKKNIYKKLVITELK